MFSLLLKGGRIVDPRNDIDRVADIGFADGKVAAVDSSLPADQARRVIDVGACLVVPGLVDLHTHVYVHGTSLGVDADELARRSGTTTFVDAGSSGAGNLAGFRRHVIERSRVRIIAFLNVSFPGIFGFGEGIMVGECLDQRLLHAEHCMRVCRENADLITGVKVRIGIGTSGSLGIHPLDIAIDAADRLGLPVMSHIGAPPPSVDLVLDRLRPGDILTHCYRPFPNAVVSGDGRPRPSFLRARERGVVFDIGHGSGSFGFETCRAMVENGIPPDVISSDVHMLSAKGPAYDLLVTASKFLNLGMSLTQVLRATTCTPAAAIRRTDIGHLGTGAAGDAAVLRQETGTFEFADTTGAVMTGDTRLAHVHTVVGGEILTED